MDLLGARQTELLWQWVSRENQSRAFCPSTTKWRRVLGPWIGQRIRHVLPSYENQWSFEKLSALFRWHQFRRRWSEEVFTSIWFGRRRNHSHVHWAPGQELYRDNVKKVNLRSTKGDAGGGDRSETKGLAVRWDPLRRILHDNDIKQWHIRRVRWASLRGNFWRFRIAYSSKNNHFGVEKFHFEHVYRTIIRMLIR